MNKGVGEHVNKKGPTNFVSRGLLVLLFCVLVSCAAPPSTVDNTALISSISVVMDNNYPPYAFVDDEGSLQGILVDQWKLWEERTDVKVDIVGLPWADALGQMKAGEFDVIDTIFYTPERSKVYDYTKPYAEINVRIFFRENISGIANAQSLKGFRVAVKAGDANAEYLLEEGISSLVYYDSYEKIVEATADNEENIFVIDEPPALYFLYKNDIQNEFSYSEPLYSGEFHRAVKKGDTALLELINQGFSNISAQEYEKINNRWLGVTQTNELSRIMPYLGTGITLALIIIISLSVLSRTLQANVKKRTNELEEALAHLKESEALFRDSIEFLPIPIGIANADGKIIELNHKFSEHYGYTIEDTPTISKWIDTAYPDPKYRQEATAQWNEDVAKALVDKKNTTPREYLVTGKDGSLHNVEIMMRPTGELWITTFVEITERKKAEEKLRKSKERYRAVVDNQTEFIVRCKIDGTRIFVNDAYCRYFEIKREDAIGTSFFYLIKEEDQAVLKEKISRLVSGPVDVETDIHRAIKPDGSVVWQEWTDKLIRDEDGQAIEIQSVGRDITERKQAEELLRRSEEDFRLLAENSTDMISRHDPNGTYLYVSPACRVLLGFDPEELIGHSAFEFIHPDDLEKLEKSRQMVTEEPSVDIIQFRARRKDGSHIWFESTSRPLKNKENGEVFEIQVSSRDITERKRTQAALQESEERFRDLFENMNDGFALHKIILDKIGKPVDYQFVDVNPVFVERVGMKAEDLINHTALELFPNTEQEWIDVFGQVATSGQPIQFTNHSVEFNKYYETRLYCPRPGYFAGIFADITKRKQAEEDLHKAYESTLWGWAKALEYRDKETEGHSRRVVEITRTLSLAIGINEEDELTNIRRGAILHDIGKLAIPDYILLKSGVLTAKEWDIMSQHPRLGYEMISEIDYLKDSLDIIISHHERWNGSGYPKGLKGEEIPLAARIFSVADVWDAVQSNRPYKKAWSREEAVEYLGSNTGKLFDPNIIKVFLALAEQGKI